LVWPGCSCTLHPGRFSCFASLALCFLQAVTKELFNTCGATVELKVLFSSEAPTFWAAHEFLRKNSCPQARKTLCARM
jgi:hypothetical protein